MIALRWITLSLALSIAGAAVAIAGHLSVDLAASSLAAWRDLVTP